MAIDHYENFPVASILLPRRLRVPVEEIYRFARHADDIADEGDAPAAQRLADLAELRQVLARIEAGNYPPAQRWSELARVIGEHRLPVGLFADLLTAFEQDARGTIYRDYTDLLAYCRYSANPIGRLLLALYERVQAPLLQWSDAICTGLQLVNFWQDIARDHAIGRVYIPESELLRFGVDRSQIGEQRVDAAWTRMIAAQTQRARELLQSGRPLAAALGGRVAWELRLVIQGGLRIAERIDAVGGDVFRRRPVLGQSDWAAMAWRSVAMP